MIDDNGQKLVPAVQNAMTIIRLLANSGRPLGATQIARETGLNVSSAFNILRTLSFEGLLSFDAEAKTYRIGMGLMELAAPLLGASPADLIRPLMSAIAEEHRITIALWQITGDERIVLIDRFTAPNIVQAVISRGSRLPVFAGAIGRVYAASLGLSKPDTQKGYNDVRWQNAPGFKAYWADVQAARESGIARDRGNLFRGLDIVAVLSRDAAGTPRLGMSSITITGQQDEESLVRIGSALASAARQVERGVFGRPGES